MNLFSSSSFQQTYFIVLITLLVGQGDGQWKKPSRELIQHDLKLYKKISENIKQEIEAFYEDYPEETINDYFLEEIDYVQDKIRNLRKITSDKTKEIYFGDNRKKDNAISTHPEVDSSNPMEPAQKTTVNINKINLKWPKFEDILLDIGKQYDFKNDRWIKVKKKNNKKETQLGVKTSVDHQKHNFKYRIVKLNRAKSKRNIVIAVTAVR